MFSVEYSNKSGVGGARDDERLVIWIDDDAVRSKLRIPIADDSEPPHDTLQDGKSQLLYWLREKTRYTVVLSDEKPVKPGYTTVFVESALPKLSQFREVRAHLTGSASMKPDWLSVDIWNMIVPARRVVWILDIFDQKQPPGFILWRSERQLMILSCFVAAEDARAQLALSRPERGWSKHRLLVFSQAPSTVRENFRDEVPPNLIQEIMMGVSCFGSESNSETKSLMDVITSFIEL